MKTSQSTLIFASPVGTLQIASSEKGMTELKIVNKKLDQTFPHHKGLNQIEKQLENYFKGSLTTFDIPGDVAGTAFQKAVWKETAKIPFGKTLTYSDIAKKIGHPKAVRAVGTALGKNPLCIVVPCHRVLPKSGGVGNYAYGSKVKEWLLEHEKKVVSH